MDDLVQWYGEQLDEDEAAAQDCVTRDGRWRAMGESVLGDDNAEVVSMCDLVDAAHIARHDPARVLREIEAKRQVLAMAQARIEEAASSDYLVNGPARMALVVMEPVLKSLASVYADRPGFRPEWGADLPSPHEDEPPPCVSR
ncbi:DUF6221 family protein [Streptomyces kanamyceticus]|uniref:DUF6221 family protein n=1 Tax=Streptomyces kanamyceticus TaxID=1967 RepID=UPI0037DDB4C3